MKKRTDNNCRLAAARMTIVELMVVIAIITLLGALTLGAGQTLRRRAAISRTIATIQKLEMLLDSVYGGNWERADWIAEDPDYTYMEAERLLDHESDLDAREVREIGGEFVVVDGWGEPIRIRKGGYNDPGLDIWSAGPDAEHGTEDDVVNWTRDWKP